MNDLTKTLIYVGAAVVICGAAWLTLPGPVGVKKEEEIGKPLFPDFADPLAAASLEIDTYDADLAEIRTFKVAKVDDVWSIPSHQGYPADAKEQIRDAATLLNGLRVIDVARDDASEHKLLGVLQPDKDKTKVGDEGVGTLVTMRDDKGETLASLIVGKPIKDRDGQRFVRIPGRDRVYAVEIDTGKLSMKFSDWIEKDLLQFNTFDVSKIELRDYSVQIAATPDGRPVFNYDQRSEIVVRYDDDKVDWVLESLKERLGDKMVPTQLVEGEELNEGKLNELKAALDNLKIVDVERKPKGLGADLKADEGFLNDREGLQSLVDRGFYPSRDGELLSSDGEVRVVLTSGVEYILRFGRIEGTEEGSDDKLNRYLFVSAKVNEDALPKLELLTVPPRPDLPDAPAPTDAAPGAGSDENTGAAGDDDVPAPADAADDAAKDPAANEEKPGDKSTGDKPADDKSTDSGTSSDTPTPPDNTPATTPPAKDPRLIAWEQQKELIDQENQRMLDEHQEQKEEAVKKVRDLNYRFADWYYVISEDEFKKIHLGRKDIIQESEEARKGGYGIDAFHELKDGGVDKPADTGPGTDPHGHLPGTMPQF